MTGSTAASAAQQALAPSGLFCGDLSANVIKTLADNKTKDFCLDDGRIVRVKDNKVEIVPVNPKRF